MQKEHSLHRPPSDLCRRFCMAGTTQKSYVCRHASRWTTTAIRPERCNGTLRTIPQAKQNPFPPSMGTSSPHRQLPPPFPHLPFSTYPSPACVRAIIRFAFRASTSVLSSSDACPQLITMCQRPRGPKQANGDVHGTYHARRRNRCAWPS